MTELYLNSMKNYNKMNLLKKKQNEIVKILIKRKNNIKKINLETNKINNLETEQINNLEHNETIKNNNLETKNVFSIGRIIKEGITLN